MTGAMTPTASFQGACPADCLSARMRPVGGVSPLPQRTASAHAFQGHGGSMTVPGGSLAAPNGSMAVPGGLLPAPGGPGGSMTVPGGPVAGLMAVPSGASKAPSGNLLQVPVLPGTGGNTLSPMKQYHSVGVLPHASANPIAFGSPVGEGFRSARGSTPPMAALAQPAPPMPRVVARESPLRQTSLGGRSSCPSSSPMCTHRDTQRDRAKPVDIEVLSSVRRRISVDCAAVQKRCSSASMRDEETYPKSELLEDVKKTKETCANIQDRFAGLEAMLLTKKDEEETVTQDETAETGECWRRVGRLEGELQQVRHHLECRENELKDLRMELQSKDCMIKEMDQKAAEWGKGLANNAEKLEQECSNKVQRLQELEVLSDSLEHKNQSLGRELATCRDRRNELEKLLDESALEVNKIQKRHEEQLEEVQSQLADKESSSALQVNKIQKLHGEQLGEIQSQLADKELALHDFKSRDRSCQAEKENKRLRETVQEQKRVLSDLESELRQERNVASLPKPGDFLRMAKQRDGEGFARDNALLKLRNKGGC